MTKYAGTACAEMASRSTLALALAMPTRPSFPRRRESSSLRAVGRHGEGAPFSSVPRRGSAALSSFPRRPRRPPLRHSRAGGNPVSAGRLVVAGRSTPPLRARRWIPACAGMTKYAGTACAEMASQRTLGPALAMPVRPSFPRRRESSIEQADQHGGVLPLRHSSTRSMRVLALPWQTPDN
jgi:hypothetical protein